MPSTESFKSSHIIITMLGGFLAIKGRLKHANIKEKKIIFLIIFVFYFTKFLIAKYAGFGL